MAKSSSVGIKLAAAAAAGLTLAALTSPGHHHHKHAHGGAVATLESLLASIGTPASGGAGARQAVAYVKAQLGKPYCWGGTGSSCFDCSGLVMEAYASAGVSIPRTSQAQWAWGVASGKQISMSHLLPGSLIFYAGADGSAASPGHVVMYLGGGLIGEAYMAGTPIRIARIGTPPGEQAAVGAIDPTAGG